MGLLDNIPGLVAANFGETIFRAATLRSTSAKTADGRGGFTNTTTTADVRAFVDDYSQFMRAVGNIAADERRVLIIAHGLTNPPKAEDVVTMDATEWTLLQVNVDPAGAVYTCRARPVA